jgi:sulfur carrier protein
MIEVFINGVPEQLAEPASVAALLAARDLVGKRVAVERNGEIVPKSRHAETPLAPGDRIEIVVAVGGG